MVEMQLWPREEVFTVMAALEVFKFMMLGIDRRCFINNDGNNIWQPLSLTQNYPRVYQLLQIFQSVVSVALAVLETGPSMIERSGYQSGPHVSETPVRTSCHPSTDAAAARNRTPALRVPAKFPAKLPVGDIGPCLAADYEGKKVAVLHDVGVNPSALQK
ncbi:hypothetical protein BDD12DRAFT_803092 [Trichophaea hybrida]|nr:hypothetical protein BDD12DRAFT_803092 [Trichophaea hybrida]